MPVPAICSQCSTEFKVSPSKLKMYKNLFCTQSCFSEWQTGKNYKEQGKTLKVISCTFDGCSNKHQAKGYCRQHYHKFHVRPARQLIKHLKNEKRLRTLINIRKAQDDQTIQTIYCKCITCGNEH